MARRENNNMAEILFPLVEAGVTFYNRVLQTDKTQDTQYISMGSPLPFPLSVDGLHSLSLYLEAFPSSQASYWPPLLGVSLL